MVSIKECYYLRFKDLFKAVRQNNKLSVNCNLKIIVYILKHRVCNSSAVTHKIFHNSNFQYPFNYFQQCQLGGRALLEWDKVKREAKYTAPLKTSDHICKTFLHNVKESVTHPSCTACCILVGKVMEPPAPILVVCNYKWFATLQIYGWVKEGWFFGLPFTWPQPIIFFFFEVTYKTKVLKVTSL